MKKKQAKQTGKKRLASKPSKRSAKENPFLDLAPGEIASDDRADRILKRGSRSARWSAAVNKAILARAEIDDALSELNDIKSEFEDWRDNMPDNLHGSPLYEKLDAVCDLEFSRDDVMDLLDVL